MHTTTLTHNIRNILGQWVHYSKQEMHVNQRQISVKPNAATYIIEKRRNF